MYLRCVVVADGLRTIFLWQRTGKLAGTVNWGTATVVGVFAGMLFGGSKAASESVVSMLTAIEILLCSFPCFLLLFFS